MGVVTNKYELSHFYYVFLEYFLRILNIFFAWIFCTLVGIVVVGKQNCHNHNILLVGNVLLCILDSQLERFVS